jgi:hypothetical protein
MNQIERIIEMTGMPPKADIDAVGWLLTLFTYLLFIYLFFVPCYVV